MARKVFISFLGTSNYSEQKYYIQNNKETATEPLRFVQEASINHFCSNFSDDDKIILLLTKKALKQNWEDFEHTDFHTKEKQLKKGLKSRFEKLGLMDRVEVVEIKKGESENEIWDIFQTIFDQLQLKDQLHFDITHSFRSGPMLLMTLINYAKFLKEIEVKGVYYGAFETGDKEYTPIWNLVSFSELQDWTTASGLFIRYGLSSDLSKLANEEIIPMLRQSNEKTQAARKIKKFLTSLDRVTDSLQTNRGTNIVKGEIFRHLRANLKDVENDLFIVPMKPLLKKIEQKINKFSEIEEWINGFRAVEWCIEHSLIQQGITMLQESIFTYYCVLHGLDYQDKGDRDLISACFYIKSHSYEDDTTKWNHVAQSKASMVMDIVRTIPSTVASNYESLTDGARNDINHGGFSKNAKPKSLKDQLSKVFKTIIDELNIKL